MKTVIHLSSLLILCLALSAEPSLAAKASPPSSATIYQHVEQLWSSRKFSELDHYVRELKQTWPGYAPVELTLATYNYKYGTQIEDSIKILKALRGQLTAKIDFASPVFLDLLDSCIQQEESLLKFFVGKKKSRKQRFAEENPLKKSRFTFSNHWVGQQGELLYFNVPEVFLTQPGAVSGRVAKEEASGRKLEALEEQQLVLIMNDLTTTMSTRKSAVSKLVRKRADEGGLKALINGFDEADVVYTYYDTVEALVQMGTNAVPSVLEVVKDFEGASSDKTKCAIWALVRIGVINSDVVKTLQQISTDAVLPSLAEYARLALNHLQQVEKERSSVEISPIGP